MSMYREERQGTNTQRLSLVVDNEPKKTGEHEVFDKTGEFYGLLKTAYDYFNEALFDSSLPDVLITVTRKKCKGYFSPNRWTVRGEKTHELAINPGLVGKATLGMLLETIVHNQVHCWQTEFGIPGRERYHNREYAEKSHEIGLACSSTGQTGGKTTGQAMDNFVLENGKFELATRQFVLFGFRMEWVEMHDDPQFENAPTDKARSIAESLDPRNHPAAAEAATNERISDGIVRGSGNGAANDGVLEVQPDLFDGMRLPEDELDEEEIALANTILGAGVVVPDSEDLDEMNCRKNDNKTQFRCGCGVRAASVSHFDATCNKCGTKFEVYERPEDVMTTKH